MIREIMRDIGRAFALLGAAILFLLAVLLGGTQRSVADPTAPPTVPSPSAPASPPTGVVIAPDQGGTGDPGGGGGAGGGAG
ncbi:hypothetical protein A5657_22270 [Mycobacterium kubicae]|nr:hypothetical protein A5657_22270 [Mycobacterium kubicae]